MFALLLAISRPVAWSSTDRSVTPPLVPQLRVPPLGAVWLAPVSQVR
ncbi:hypothetical protein HMPREF9006_0507 [Actinomyces sp. oral taxon 180 str. F0310]|nr:hypothetical protein HMPREF9006_0507 [Actinomyces sp. oral taxon 180 str. F0310]